MADAILKTCATCRQHKSTAEFSAHRCRPDGLRGICKACQQIENRASYLRHQERRQADARARMAEWRKIPENAEKNRRWAAHWYLANAERAKRGASRWGIENPELKRAADRDYRAANRGRINAHIKKYKIRKRQAVPAWANLDAIAAIYQRSEQLTRATGVRHHVDHFYPLQSPRVCGLHCESNLRVIPAVDNLKKGNRIPVG